LRGFDGGRSLGVANDHSWLAWMGVRSSDAKTQLALRCAFACAALLVTMHVRAAEAPAADPAARATLQAAFDRQEALPGYVEHLFGRSPVMPPGDSALAGAVVERLTEKLREQVSQAASQAPLGAVLADSALAGLQDQKDDNIAIAFGPEQKFTTIQHAGKRQRETFSEGAGELVRVNGRMALLLNLEPQIARLRRAAAVNVAETVIDEVQSVRTTLRSLSQGLAQAGAAGVLGGAVAIFDEVNLILANARATAQIFRVVGLLEKMSGHWQCAPDDSLVDTPESDDVRQLADEAMNGVTTHVYERTRVFSGGFRIETLTWIRVTDGLPARSVFVLPTGDRQRTEYEYPASVEFELPDCLSAL
jgi:hypothetical protein